MMLSASIPCTCGELFQGYLDGYPCLVSCPINLYSTAIVSLSKTTNPVIPLQPKTEQAVLYAKSSWDIRNDLTVIVHTPLPSAKGYGTSTADIGAVLYALGAAANFELSSWQATQIAISIEPTDSTFFEDCTLLDHLQGKFSQPLGQIPAHLGVVVLDPGGEVDSISFNQQDWRLLLKPLADEHRHAFELLRWGIAKADLEAIGAAASLSAMLHQTILSNPLFESCQNIVKTIGALGLCRAHSGTILGILYDERVMQPEAILSSLEEVTSRLENVHVRRVIAGGAKVMMAIQGRET